MEKEKLKTVNQKSYKESRDTVYPPVAKISISVKKITTDKGISKAIDGIVKSL
jgi:hypothetical protein